MGGVSRRVSRNRKISQIFFFLRFLEKIFGNSTKFYPRIAQKYHFLVNFEVVKFFDLVLFDEPKFGHFGCTTL